MNAFDPIKYRVTGDDFKAPRNTRGLLLPLVLLAAATILLIAVR